jgi:hypothetical protein
MKTHFSIALIFLTLSIPQIFAQQSHTPPTPAQMVANRVARLTAILTLNTTQQGQATTIFTTEQTALSGLPAAMKAARTALLTAEEAADTAGMAAQATQIGSLTTQEVTAQATANSAFYGILDQTQQTNYKQLIAHGGLGGPFGFRGGRR